MEEEIEDKIDIEEPVITNKRETFTVCKDAYLEPFNHNWIRKLVFRTPKFNKQGRVGPLADVCYISPEGRKLWTMKKLKNYLLSNQNGLTENNFTYTARPLGVDETKEILDYSRRTIDDAASEPVVPDTMPDVPETPDLSDASEIPKSPRISEACEIDQQEIILTNTKKNTRSNLKTSGPFSGIENLNHKNLHKRRKELKVDSTSTKRVKPDVSSKLPRVKSHRSCNTKIINSERYEKYFPQPNSMQALIDYHKSLQSVFRKLDIADLLHVRLVCTTWRDIADKPSFWDRIVIDRLRIVNWYRFGKFLENHKTKYLNIKRLVDAQYVNWADAAKAIAKTNVSHLELQGCSVSNVETILQNCTQLFSVVAVLNNLDTINLDNMDKMHQHDSDEALQVFYESTEGINIKGDLAPLLSLSDLTNLTLKTFKNLTTLKLGEGMSFASTNIQDLRYLRVEKLEKQALISFNIIDGISSLTRLEHLELIDFEVGDNFDEYLQKCKHLNSLMLVPAYSTAITNKTVLKGILSLKGNLKYVIWGVHVQQLKKTKNLLWGQYQAEQRDIDFMPFIEPVPFLYLIDKNVTVGNKQEKNDDESSDSFVYTVKMLQLTQLEKLMMHAMPKTIVSILKTEKFRAGEATDCKQEKYHTVFTK